MTNSLQQAELQNIESTFRSMNQAIWVVTGQSNDRRGGLTATWIHQASIDRENPSVLIGLAPNHFTCELVLESGYCVIHLLGLGQSNIAWEFSQPSSRARDKFAEFNVSEYTFIDNADNPPRETRAPWLTDCHTALGCKTLQHFHAGDRVYFLSQVAAAIKHSEEPYLREADFFGACTPKQIEKLRTDLDSDVALQRPLLADWLAGIKNS